MIIDASSNGGAVFLLEGDVLCINLDSNPSTGYIWNLDPNALDPNVVVKVTDTFTPENDLPGSGGTEKWFFRGLAPGSTTISMEYRQPWTTVPSDTFTVDVTLPDVSIDESQNGEVVSLQKGDILCISLDSNPSTGYGWDPDPNLFDPNVLTKLDNGFISSAPGIPGAGGTERWFFAASAPGQTPISLSYQAPWDAGPAVDTFDIQVVVFMTTDASLNGLYNEFWMPILLEEGQTLSIELDANPTTGYLWELDPNTCDANIVSPITDVYLPAGNLTGSGGTKTWYLQGTGPGMTTLSIDLWGPGGTEPAETFEVNLQVVPPAQLYIGAESKGEVVDHRAGNIVCLSLDAEEGWGLDEDLYDDTLIKKLGEGFVPPKELPSVAGDDSFYDDALIEGGTYRWYFEGTGIGETILVLYSGSGDHVLLLDVRSPHDDFYVLGKYIGELTNDLAFLQQGEILQIRLASNPDTGYTWTLMEDSFDKGILKKVAYHNLGPSSYSQAEDRWIIGSGLEDWYFKVIGTGDTTIHLEYIPDGTGSKKEFDLEIRVPIPEADLYIDYSDNGSLVSLQTGDLMCITLDDNHTPSKWRITEGFCDPNVLKCLTNRYLPSGSETEKWYFEAARPGQTVLFMGYRPWFVPENQPYDTFVVIIDVP